MTPKTNFNKAGFEWPKLIKLYSWKNLSFWKNYCNLLIPWSAIMDFYATREAFSAKKRTFIRNFFTFSIFMGQFYPSGSGSGSSRQQSVRNRIRNTTTKYCSGSITFWCGCGSMSLPSGSGSCYFRHWPSSCQQKTNLKKVFLLNNFWKYIYIIFQSQTVRQK